MMRDLAAAALADRKLLTDICEYLDALYPGVPTAAREARKIRAHLNAPEDAVARLEIDAEQLRQETIKRDANSRHALWALPSGSVVLKVVITGDQVAISMPPLPAIEHKQQSDRDARTIQTLRNTPMTMQLRPGDGTPWLHGALHHVANDPQKE